MEHIRGLPDNNCTMGIGLGLPTYLFLLYKYCILDHGRANNGSCHIAELDVDEQIPEAAGPLHTTPCGPPTLAGFYCVWLPAWSDQGSSDALSQCGK